MKPIRFSAEHAIPVRPLTLNDFYLKSWLDQPLMNHIVVNEVEISSNFTVSVPNETIAHLGFKRNHRKILKETLSLSIDETNHSLLLNDNSKEGQEALFYVRLDSHLPNSAKLLLFRDIWDYKDVHLVFKCSREEPVDDNLEDIHSKCKKERYTLSAYYKVTDRTANDEKSYVFKVDLRSKRNWDADQNKITVNIECEDPTISIDLFVSIFQRLKEVYTQMIEYGGIVAELPQMEQFNMELLAGEPSNRNQTSDGVQKMIKWIANSYSEGESSNQMSDPFSIQEVMEWMAANFLSASRL